MKKNKYLKSGLVFLAAMFMILSTNCNLFNNNDDVEVIKSIASSTVGDMSALSNQVNTTAAQRSPAWPCEEFTLHYNINQSCAPWIQDSSPGHGWYSGYFDFTMYANCNFHMSIQTGFNCILGAVVADTHDKLGGTLNIGGTCDINATSGAVTMTLTEQSLSFEVNGRSHNVFLTLRVNGNSSGGTITLSGSIDGDPIFDTISY